MAKLWTKISEIGINESLDRTDKKSIIFANRICSIAFILSLLSLIINFLLKTWLFVPALSIVLIILLLSFALNHFGFYLWSKINILIAIAGLISFMSFSGGYGSGLEYYFLSLTALPVFLFKDKKLIYFFQFLFILCLIAQKFYAPVPDGMGATAAHKVFYVFNSASSSLLIILAIIFFKNLTLKNEEELKNKNKIIEDKNVLLEETNKQLETFSYSVSHDLKAPLRAMDGYSSILEADHANDMSDSEKELVGEIRKAASKMKEMIDNLLLLSRSSKKELIPSQIDMVELTNNIIKSFKPEIEKYKTRIIVSDLPKITADKDLMSHVLENLIGNAIKYSRNKIEPKIEIGAFKEQDYTTYFVKDNGAGFNMKYSDKLFIPFQRLHYETEFEGTGVGLSIVKNIILRHKGKVWVEAKEGEGATFYFSLPESIS
jgi:signal transduction histidine kinase